MNATRTFVEQVPQATTQQLRFSCPVCRRDMQGFNPLEFAQTRCAGCGFVLRRTGHILRALPPARELHFREFITQYETVRAREGRGSLRSEYYLSLPFKDLTGNNPWQWEIRKRTFENLTDKVLGPLEQVYPQGLDVLDIGAGNCWLSYQLACRGHRPVAVDLLDNDSDGLGSARHYFAHLPQPFVCAQTEMDRLPFVGGQFDIVIFNAAFHYSVDYAQTLAEAMRCLRRPGYLVIADSPFYSSDRSGQKMIEEKRSQFAQQFGFRSDSIASCEYLTQPILDQLAAQFDLQWSTLKPWYGFNWALRPLKAAVLRKREPSNFYIFWSKIREADRDTRKSGSSLGRHEVPTI